MRYDMNSPETAALFCVYLAALLVLAYFVADYLARHCDHGEE